MDMNSAADMVSMDDLLDGTLDDLKDVPAFKVYAPGAHKVKISWQFKDIGDQKNCPEIKLTHIETLELNDPNQTPPEAGDECSMAFMFKNKDGTANEFAQGNFKLILVGLKALAPEGSTPRQIMDATNGAEIIALTDVRLKDKKDKDSAQYLVIKEVAIP